MEEQISSHIANEPKVSKTKPVPVLSILLAIILIVAACTGVYFWQQSKINKLNSKVSVLSNASTKLQGQTSSSASTNKAAPATISPTETDILDNGATITYPLNVGNANIVWWSSDYTTPASEKFTATGQMNLSDKRVEQFLSLIPFDTLGSICGQSTQFSDHSAIQLYTLDPKTKTLQHNQYENCISAVVNSKSKYASQASEVLSQSQSDLNAFVSSLSYKEK